MNEIKELNTLILQLDDGWHISANHHLCKEYKFKNFADAMSFANSVFVIAEQLNHHPKLIIEWGKCTLELYTHDTSSITQQDINLAKKISDLKTLNI